MVKKYIDQYGAQTLVDAINSKQDELTAGDGISISNGTIGTSTGAIYRTYCDSYRTNQLVASGWGDTRGSSMELPLDSNDQPADGAIVSVTYEHDYQGNSSEPAELNVDNTGSFPIIYAGKSRYSSCPVAAGQEGRTIYYMFAHDLNHGGTQADSQNAGWIWLGQDSDKDTTYDFSVIDVELTWDDNDNIVCPIPAHEIYKYIAKHRVVRLKLDDIYYRCLRVAEDYSENQFTYSGNIEFIALAGDVSFLISCDYNSPAPQSQADATERVWNETWDRSESPFLTTTDMPLYIAKAYNGTCTVAAGTGTKTTFINNYLLVVGNIVTVKFSNTNTVTSSALKLKVSNTDAKVIHYDGSNLTSANAGMIAAGSLVTFQYDGTYYNIINIYPEGGSEPIPLSTVQSWFT